MNKSNLKDSLPEPDGQLLDFIFEHVYGDVEQNGDFQTPESDKPSDLLRILQSLQRFNYRHRMDEIREIYPLVSGPLEMDPNSNSEGSFLWLAMLLAVKELYDLNNSGLKRAVSLISVRK